MSLLFSFTDVGTANCLSMVKPRLDGPLCPYQEQKSHETSTPQRITMLFSPGAGSATSPPAALQLEMEVVAVVGTDIVFADPIRQQAHTSHSQRSAARDRQGPTGGGGCGEGGRVPC